MFHVCPTCGGSLPEDQIRVEFDSGVIIGNGRYCALTQSEMNVFERLRKAKGVVVSKDQLLTSLCKLLPDDEPEIKIIDVYVCKMRGKLNGMGIDIKTVWGSGYRMTFERKQQDVV